MKFRIILCLLFLLSCKSGEKSATSLDNSLIIPGNQAEGYIIDSVINSESTMKYPTPGNDLSKITSINHFSGLTFDSVVYHDTNCILFIKKNSIIAIAGMSMDNKITSDAVLLSRGADNFIFNYGNKDLLTFRIKKNTAYIYNNLGIAIFDDNNDNVIDMYIVFKVQSSSH